MAKNKHLDHAAHNNGVCDYLNKEDSYTDWTVISAFYSALHFVSHKIFPISAKTEDGHRFNVESVEEYINVFKRNQSVTKHYVLVDLVYEKCNKETGHKYRKLLDLSKTARYSDYNVAKPVAEAARKLLEEIRKYCN